MPYIPHSPEEQIEMLKSIGISSLDDLFKDIPADQLVTITEGTGSS